MGTQLNRHSGRITGFCRLLLLDGPRSSAASRSASQEAARAVRRVIAFATALILLPLGETALLAQQAPAPPWPQNEPLGSQYAPDPQSGYGQPGYPQPQQSQPYGQQPYPADGQPPQQGYGQAQPLRADQLEQLAAPIALYPDTLLAQVLAASTYPAQVVQADRWRQSQGDAPADHIVAGANMQNWDPSVKALTAFPQVLAQMDQNLQWTTDLGNAYYNQPQDVLEAVQLLRQRAQAAGNLQSSPQETVSYNQSNIELASPSPQVVYVPAYNPWAVYGQPVPPYPGFSLLGALGSIGSFLGALPVRFGPGILMSAFSATPWGWLGWALSWLNLSVLFNHGNYYSHSTTVADWGFPHGGLRAASERGAFARTANNSYRPSGSYERNQYDRGSQYNRAYNGGYNGTARQNFAPAGNNYATNRPADGFGRAYAAPQSGYARPATTQAYNRAASTMPQYGRSTYGSSYYGGAASAYNNRPGAYGNSMQTYRAPSAGFQQGSFGNRSSGTFSSNGFVGTSSMKQPHSSSFHSFGGGHASERFHAPKSFKAPKSGGGHSGRGHGGGRHRL